VTHSAEVGSGNAPHYVCKLCEGDYRTTQLAELAAAPYPPSDVTRPCPPS
jgi:hypothetical protein